MGNDQSLSTAIEIQQKSLEITDFYSHHRASVNFGNKNSLSVFIGEPVLDGSIWSTHTPLEKSAKNLMIYRHPCILKYVSSWEKAAKFHLAVEDVRPLSHTLASLNNLQICIGLYSVLKALTFLHDKADMSHNNVCMASIYVTSDGNWKLGGMEYSCKFKDISLDFLNKTKSYRYNKAIDPNETKYLSEGCRRIDFIDLYGFCVLANEVLKRKSDETPFQEDFLQLCKSNLQMVDLNQRLKLRDLLNHVYFNHDFLKIHCFLTELPVKSDSEKNEFFNGLVEKLRLYKEDIVASQLNNLLLSRMVLLNKSAQANVIPYVLCPKETNDENGLFTIETFKTHITPKLLEIFCVRDAQIRLLLLEHLTHYLHCFDEQELRSHILPELLVGIKDTNDHLVSVTLRALADLVPILGAATVIGGKRAKLFNDGRPIAHSIATRRLKKMKPESNPVPLAESEVSIIENNLDLPERPSPDGEEGETSTEDLEPEAEEEDNWEDWEMQERDAQDNEAQGDATGPRVETSASMNLNSSTAVVRKSLPDISELDIKNQKNAGSLDEINFFQDMEPVIEHAKFPVPSPKVDDDPVSKKFRVMADGSHEEGWEEEEDW